MGNRGKPVMIMGFDESEHGIYALRWALDHFFPIGQEHQFKLIVAHAKPIPPNVIHGQGTGGYVSGVERDLKKVANRTISKAMEICEERSVRVTSEILEGDARHAICEAVERHGAAILVLGGHNHGRVRRMFLGSVSDYCAHHAHCSVVIVKKPKRKHCH
ncbi:hypothetical protein L6164_025446 [Bauhinia variegata]|uniref:Uncharacterized protein n=1 Tax=Bauhinia variegata TaxID=167791 RepID=A0ACB9M3S5_BAUVA|nr:hypothetical protein L6164_025446 [Bauhinia variegata]